MPTQVRGSTQIIALSLTNAEVATAAAIAESKIAAPTLASSTYATPANLDQYLADRMYSLQQASITASLGSSVAVAGSNLASVASSIAVVASTNASIATAVRHSHKFEQAPTVATASSSLYTLATAPIDWPAIHVNGLRQERAYDWTAASSIATVVTFLAGAIPTTDDRVRVDHLISN